MRRTVPGRWEATCSTRILVLLVSNGQAISFADRELNGERPEPSAQTLSGEARPQ
jgi:hypothetical protein